MVRDHSVGRRRLDGAQYASRRAQLIQYRAPERLESSALRRSQIIGKHKGGQFLQRVTEAGQCLLKSHGFRRPGGFSAELGPCQSERIGQETTAIPVIRCAVGRHQSSALARRQVMLVASSEDGLLVLDTECCQGAGQGRPNGAGGQLLLGDGPQLRVQLQATLDPIRCMPEQFCDGFGSEAVFFGQRRHHAGLVQGRNRPRWSISDQQQPLVLDGRGRGLDDDRDGAVPLPLPALEAFESVQDLVASLGAGHDTYR
ncbi:hypothetical protein ACFL5O_10310 [Myxococcota bacterium]